MKGGGSWQTETEATALEILWPAQGTALERAERAAAQRAVPRLRLHLEAGALPARELFAEAR